MKNVTTQTVTSAGDPIIVGFSYRMSAPNTGNEFWKITSIDEEKLNVEAKSDKFSYARTFGFDALGFMKPVKKAVTESVELVGKIMDAEMWVENIIYWPLQKRRGRKPQVKA